MTELRYCPGCGSDVMGVPKTGIQNVSGDHYSFSCANCGHVTVTLNFGRMTPD